MQLRRLDPMANAGPYQRLLKNPVKSVSLSEAQYDWVKANRPQLVVTEGEAAVIGLPLMDFLEVNYAYPDIEMFVDRFPAMLEKLSAATDKKEAPRGMVLAFRDRPNRMTADTVFWSVGLEEGEQWVEMNLVAVPQQDEPGPEAGDYSLVEADDKEIAQVEAEVTGRTPLTPNGVKRLRENAKLVRVLRPKPGGPAAGLLALRTEPGGWGVIDLALIKDEAAHARKDIFAWAVAWLRNNGGRRVRKRCGVDDSAELTALKELGFTPGEAGLYLTRSVDKAEVEAKLAERKAHGTIIKFGDWR
ncbi:MAG TPA: hypothetical protein VNN10_01230 [Dehalococcoidia bacterium]|nr:hypothetical protein [Dehalococcoidia bacterium]